MPYKSKQELEGLVGEVYQASPTVTEIERRHNAAIERHRLILWDWVLLLMGVGLGLIVGWLCL